MDPKFGQVGNENLLETKIKYLNVTFKNMFTAYREKLRKIRAEKKIKSRGKLAKTVMYAKTLINDIKDDLESQGNAQPSHDE